MDNVKPSFKVQTVLYRVIYKCTYVSTLECETTYHVI